MMMQERESGQNSTQGYFITDTQMVLQHIMHQTYGKH